ncbi:recombinase family protein [Spirillospora sp. CA-253888]
MSAPTYAPARRRGRPPSCPPELLRRVVALRRQGLSLAAISDQLNEENVPTLTTAKCWNKNRVDDLLHRQYARDYIASLSRDA